MAVTHQRHETSQHNSALCCSSAWEMDGPLTCFWHFDSLVRSPTDTKTFLFTFVFFFNQKAVGFLVCMSYCCKDWLVKDTNQNILYDIIHRTKNTIWKCTWLACCLKSLSWLYVHAYAHVYCPKSYCSNLYFHGVQQTVLSSYKLVGFLLNLFEKQLRWKCKRNSILELYITFSTTWKEVNAYNCLTDNEQWYRYIVETYI